MKNLEINFEATTVRDVIVGLDRKEFEKKLKDTADYMKSLSEQLEEEFKKSLNSSKRVCEVNVNVLFERLPNLVGRVLQTYTKEELATIIVGSLYDDMAKVLDSLFQKELLITLTSQLNSNFIDTPEILVKALEDFAKFLQKDLPSYKQELQEKGIFYNHKNLMNDLEKWFEEFSKKVNKSSNRTSTEEDKINKFQSLLEELSTEDGIPEDLLDKTSPTSQVFAIRDDNSEELNNIMDYMKKVSTQEVDEDGVVKMGFNATAKEFDTLLELLEKYVEKKRKNKSNKDGNLNLDI